MCDLQIQILRLRNSDGLELPSYATPASSGMDLLAATDGPLSIKPGKCALIRTGISIALPFGYEAQIRPRSGLALKHSITVLNTPGTIDSDYRGELGIIIINHGDKIFTVDRGMRVAQIVFGKVIMASWKEVTKLPISVRDEGGFGSTGL